MQPFLNQYVLENPTVLLVLLFVLAMSAGAVYRVRRSKAALAVAAFGAAAMVVVVTLALLVDTDRERVEKLLDDVRMALHAGDAEEFRRHVHPEFSDGGSVDAAALGASVERILSVLKISRISHAAEPPRFAGDRAEVVVSLSTDVQSPAPFRGHESTWLLRLRRHEAAPRRWALSAIRAKRFEPLEERELELGSLLNRIPRLPGAAKSN